MRNNIGNEIASWWPKSDLVPIASEGATTISQTLISAIRVECALQNGNWAAAMSQTCELFEWALFESVKKLGGSTNSEREFTSAEVNSVIKALFMHNLNVEDIPQDSSGVKALIYNNNKNAPLFVRRPKDPGKWDFKNEKKWLNNWNVPGPAKVWATLIDAHTKTTSLSNLFAAINDDPVDSTLSALAHFRNFQTHQGLANDPTANMSVQNACKAFVSQKLWASTFKNFPTNADNLKLLTPGAAFMAQPKIKAVLKSVCGITNPAAEFATWVKRLEADMAKP